MKKGQEPQINNRAAARVSNSPEVTHASKEYFIETISHKKMIVTPLPAGCGYWFNLNIP
jgi:hypothetical protein